MSEQTSRWPHLMAFTIVSVSDNNSATDAESVAMIVSEFDRDRVAILEGGTLSQIGTKESLLPQPRGSFAAAFVRRLS